LTKTVTESSDFSQLGTSSHRASTAPFFDSHFADSPRNAILATCLPLPIRTAQTTPPASAQIASTPAPSNPPKAPHSSCASAPPPILPTPNIPAFPSSPAPATNPSPNPNRTGSSLPAFVLQFPF